MGNKIITEKDFWMCTGGLMPAPMQSTQLTTKKVGDFKYITVKDTATIGSIDFACKKLMFVMAMLAVAIALVTVATGGMALVAICAAAAAGGAIFGAIIGSLLCGQLAAAARYWMQSKSNMIIQGQQAITGDHKMQCMIFGDIISFAPQIKNWWQAIALGGSNFIGEVLKNAMYGAAIGCGAAVISGGPAVLSQFGLSNIGANWLATWGGYGLGLRGLMGAQHILGAYGNTGEVTGGDVVSGAFAMEIGTAKAAGNILSGRGTIDDFLGVAMWMMPAPKNSRNASEEARTNEQNRSEETRSEETREEENAQARTSETEASAAEGEHNAFEDSPTSPPTVADLQTAAIADVANGTTALNTTARKGNFGEMVTDRDLANSGYDALHDPVTDIDAATVTGIDGVYRNAHPPPEFIVVDAKYGSAQLSTLADGTRQMSDAWIDPRLNDAVGQTVADEIRASGYERVVAKVDQNGNVTYRRVDANGNVIRGNAGIFTP